MARILNDISPELKDWLQKQHVFFVATAPQSCSGLVNCSPKGMDSFRVLSASAVAYLDMAGSGIETVAHLQDDGRIVLMFCAFDGPPKIVRLHGRGQVILPDTPAFHSIKPSFPELPGIRAIIWIEVSRVSDSCGFGVPRMQFIESRRDLQDWAEKKGPDGIDRYVREKNARSIDGLPGIAPGETS